NDITSIAVADMNADGVADLAVVPDTWGYWVTVFPGNGDGTFQTNPSYWQTGYEPRSVAVADFNADGKADLAISNWYANNVTVMRGGGDGSPRGVKNYTGASHPGMVAVGDFKGDGNPDLAMVMYDGGVDIMLENADGTSQPAVNYPAGNMPMGLDVSDVN